MGGKVRANGRVVRGPDRKNLPSYRLRTEVRVAEQLLARARQLSARTLFEPLTGPEFEMPKASPVIFLTP